MGLTEERDGEGSARSHKKVKNKKERRRVNMDLKNIENLEDKDVLNTYGKYSGWYS